jgi:hypothetical protein
MSEGKALFSAGKHRPGMVRGKSPKKGILLK